MELRDFNIGRIHDGYKKKEFSCEEVVRAYLQTIAEKNTALNAYLTVDDEGAIAGARAVDERLARGDEMRALEGIPCGIKDIFAVKGLRNTNASKFTKNMIAPYDASSVTRLKDAGAIVLGKQNLDEFACGASTENSAFGVVKNPYNPEYVAGGSSGGSACSTAADMAVFSMGTDTGGSIRLPASFCNVVGLKVTYGRVSRSGVTSMAASWDTIGHFTKTVEDSARVLSVTAGHDRLDATTPEVKVDDYVGAMKGDIKGLRVGVPQEYFAEGVESEVKVRIKEQIAKLKDQGAEIVEVSLPSTKYAACVYYVTMPTELSTNLGRFDGIRYGSKPEGEIADLYDYYCSARSAGFGDEIKRRIMVGTYVSSAGCIDAYYTRALKVRTVIIEEFKRVFEKVDVLIAPVSPTGVFKIGEKMNDPIAMYLADALVIPASAAGLPAISIPSGFDSKGLPIGTQLIAPQFRESLLFLVGSKL